MKLAAGTWPVLGAVIVLALAGCAGTERAPATWFQRIERRPEAAAEVEAKEEQLREQEILADDVPKVQGSTREEAFAILLNADGFYPVRYGLGDRPNGPHVNSFGTLLKQADAPEVFADLAARGSGGGRLYGLSGLYLVDRARFDRILPGFMEDYEFVEIGLGGCDIMTMSVKWIVSGDAKWNMVHGTMPTNLKKLAAEMEDPWAYYGMLSPLPR